MIEGGIDCTVCWGFYRRRVGVGVVDVWVGFMWGVLNKVYVSMEYDVLCWWWSLDLRWDGM